MFLRGCPAKFSMLHGTMMGRFRTCLLTILLAPARLARRNRRRSRWRAQAPSMHEAVPSDRGRTIAAMEWTHGESILMRTVDDGKSGGGRRRPLVSCSRTRQRQPATEPTEVRIAYDDHNLHIGVFGGDPPAFDSSRGWLGIKRRRDEQPPPRPIHDDRTYLDARTAYYLR